MASGAVTSWEIDGEIVETVADFIFLGSKITSKGDCSHEIKYIPSSSSTVRILIVPITWGLPWWSNG